MMNYRKFLFSSAAALAVILTGCETASEYVEATDTTAAVKNKDTMSSSDWIIISQAAGKALLADHRFEQYLQDYRTDSLEKIKTAKAQGEKISAREQRNLGKPLLMLSTIRNNTPEHIDTKLMTERLREILFQSGKVRFTTYAAGSGQNLDEATAQARDLRNDSNIKKRTAVKKSGVNAYDLSLSGVIIKQAARSGRNNEISYTFSLTLTDNETGEGVWTYTKELKRQYKQGGFGW